MLGKLAKWLRILGFDTRCEPLEGREPIAAYRTREFFLLTRRAKLCGQAGVFFLKANDPWEQLREVVSLASITPQEVRLLHRCLLCNDQLREIAREEAFGKVPEYVFADPDILSAMSPMPENLLARQPSRPDDAATGAGIGVEGGE